MSVFLMTLDSVLARAELDALLIELKEARAGRGDLTQAQLAKILGLAVNSVQDWELCRDSPTLPHLILWAKELGYRLAAESHQSTDPQARLHTAESEPYEVGELRRLSSTLRIARRENGILQQELADWLGVSRWAIIRWESARGLPLPVRFLMWAHAVGCPVRLVALDAPSDCLVSISRAKSASADPVRTRMRARGSRSGNGISRS